MVLRAGRWLHVQTPFRRQEDRPSVRPVRIYACCVTAKLRRGYGGMARRASGFVARREHSTPTKRILICFPRHRHEASGGIVCTHSASAPAPPPLNFTLGTAQRRPNCRARIGDGAQPSFSHSSISSCFKPTVKLAKRSAASQEARRDGCGEGDRNLFAPRAYDWGDDRAI